MPRLKPRKPSQLERDWDPEHFVTVRNKTAHNILLDLPTGYFRLDAGRTFRMMPDIAETAQVKDLVATGQVEISR
ncbi:MAG TPA: hypothetical protein PKM78_11005 [Anaerolineae bacterium]|nr:hypothetical protein [Anaerolineae bacterium]HNU04554.1 hypothetical protein [Anaerolineae bacterium]